MNTEQLNSEIHKSEQELIEEHMELHGVSIPQENNDNYIVTDAALEKAWGFANFGEISKRDKIIEILKDVARGYNIGFTANCIAKELGLIENRNNNIIGLSDKGLMYFIDENSERQADK